jgi:hypothetical protein
MNYGNRNASASNSTSDLVVGYAAAVAASVIISVGLKKLCFNFTKHLTGASSILSNCLITYVAVATAGAVNSYCMRKAEMD